VCWLSRIADGAVTWCGVGAARSYPSKDKTARFLTADVEQLISDTCAERERLTADLRDKTKKICEADARSKKSSQVAYDSSNTLCLMWN